MQTVEASFPSSAQIAAVRDYIAENWQHTRRTCTTETAEAYALPRPYTSPTADDTFHHLFYWDTYFANIGLLRSGHADWAKDNADNFIHLTERFGFIPNFTHPAHANRSQPPLSGLLYSEIPAWQEDVRWRTQALAALEKEHTFWLSQRNTPLDLQTYGTHAWPQEVQEFTGIARDRLSPLPQDPQEQPRFVLNAMAEAESGWDFTPRFERRATEFLAVDLNACLFSIEKIIAEGHALNGDSERAANWSKYAQKRQERINTLLWDNERGGYYDYDLRNGQRSAHYCASALFMLMCGAASKEQAQATADRIGELLLPSGIIPCHTTAADTRLYQWASPNAWPPLQAVAIMGFERYGHHALAQEIARAYVRTVVANFERTGQLWEKYNAQTGQTDVSDEYPMPPMLGWTAGAFLYASERCA